MILLLLFHALVSLISALVPLQDVGNIIDKKPLVDLRQQFSDYLALYAKQYSADEASHRFEVRTTLPIFTSS